MPKNNSKKIRILHVIYSLQIGGAEMVLYNLCKGLMAMEPARFDITVACTHDKGPMAEKIEALGIRVVNLGCSDTRFFISIWRIIKLIKKINPDIVHTHLFPPDRYGLVAAFLCRVPVRISTIHNMEPKLTSIQRLTILILKWLSTRLIAVSTSAKEYYVDKYFIPEKKIVTIYNASGHALPAESVLQRVFPLKPFRIVNFDNVKAAKGQIYLIPAMKKLLDVLPDVHLDIIGDTTDNYTETIRDEIQKFGLESAVSLLGPVIEPFSVLTRYHIMVSLSLWEGFHMTLVEGMATGLPIITTPIDPHLELFECRNEVFVKHDDPTGIAARIHSVLTDPKLYLSLSDANIARSAAFSPSKMVQNYFNLYTGIFSSDC